MDLPFFNRQSKRRDQIIAIDMGGRVTKAVHMQRKGEQLNLLNYALLDTPPSDKAMSPDLLTDLLKEITKSLGNGRTRQVTLAVGVNDSVFRQIEAPLMPVADLRQMLKINSKAYLQEELSNYVFDCYYTPPRAGGNGKAEGKPSGGIAKHKVMVGGIKRQLLNDLHAGIKGAGLIADRVVPGIVGPTNAFEQAEAEVFATEPVALVDIGFKNSIITILDSGDIALNRVVGIGGDRFTSELATALNISYVEAENIKVGIPAEVQAELEPLIHPLGRELRASLDFFEHQRDKTIGQVFISGGTARSEFVLQTLQNELMVPCKTWNPAKNLQMALPSEKLAEVEQVIPQLTVAIGTAAAVF